ncbi:bifunctional phosphoribosylaminoimidazolecarboxamide formyltransferase/IMP cyclohydrolase PurH [bacterium]|nr:MAG: bifunctional phosphoribosylaminoimidazolecarboxamide formyltransferase/IMP cyclohydrolase PurH [bacterium]RKZ17888.1 MAG: bifunctional phosphoribosylaminoimidazolecarboxamide formyltransferase/IMP cyclohydrolase PurH [bacterium]
MSSGNRRALLSVTDKSGLESFARGLVERDYELLASGGTARVLAEAGIKVEEVSDYTGQDEILGGRVKTLHPAIHAGILAEKVEDLQGTGYQPIDLVVVNLYDFAGTLERTDDEGERVENIDIGGPTMLRSAAKNFSRTTVLCDPDQYTAFLEDLDSHDGMASLEFRRDCAARVFSTTAQYDGLISGGLFGGHELRYGENPHQAATWSVAGGGGLAELGLTLNGGKALSYNNLLDVVSTLKLGADLPADACAVIKHTNPCGVGRGATPLQALDNALACDPVSAFGGIVAFGSEVDDATGESLAGRFLEVVLAPSYSDGARAALSRKKNLRWLDVDHERFAAATRGNERHFGRLILRQAEDSGFPELDAPRLVAGPTPDEATQDAADLAWRVAKHVKSNAIVLAASDRTLGIGAGQMSRVDSSRIAIEKAAIAGLDLVGSVAASDGFFPFADGLETLAEAGVKCVIQPGGSIRDDEVAAAADRLGVSLLLTGTRHFRH